MGSAYRVVVRRRGKTEKTRHDTLEGALDALQARLQELANRQRPHVERAFLREVEPGDQVAVRGELRGPRGLNAGIDVRGDGSAEAFTGRLSRQVVPREAGEDVYAALRRVAAPDGR
ncbi:hypothetical protein FSW04_05805 [Baekduia soli]|uniref:Uncharacterized protein n=1 Tax=Baekduia soli TaxID=496014 RepID=A0A5B8U2J0_9ACTN|nr:hypothetical protein [Baekduia soli]QEC47151.1 hypothetical protein FSW04_05805 [Baekduia soli]